MNSTDCWNREAFNETVLSNNDLGMSRRSFSLHLKKYFLVRRETPVKNFKVYETKTPSFHVLRVARSKPTDAGGLKGYAAS